MSFDEMGAPCADAHFLIFAKFGKGWGLLGEK